jgi:Zn finger protein HypA/HybF involved in hydrogenase expression
MSKIKEIFLRCEQCSTIFRKKSKRHFKCPKCGSWFTEPTKIKRIILENVDYEPVKKSKNN